jgi:hypothetical protein
MSSDLRQMTLLISNYLTINWFFVVSGSVHEGTKEGVQPIMFPHYMLKAFFFQCIRPFWERYSHYKISKISNYGFNWQQFKSNFRVLDKQNVHSGKQERKIPILEQCNKFIVPIHEKAENIS